MFDNFSSELMIVYIDYNDQVRLELNVPFLSRATDAHADVQLGGFDAALLF